MNRTDKEFFEHLAVPHSWLLVADELYEQARVLYRSRGLSRMVMRNSPTGMNSYDLSNRSSFLLAGLSLENFIKGHLVYENPSWIANGRLAKDLRSHSLTTLAERSTKLPWPKKGRTTLLALESGINSWARYPCPLNVEAFTDSLSFDELLWEKYLKLAERYKRSLTSLVQRKWKGPHSFEGHYTFTDGF